MFKMSEAMDMAQQESLTDMGESSHHELQTPEPVAAMEQTFSQRRLRLKKKLNNPRAEFLSSNVTVEPQTNAVISPEDDPMDESFMSFQSNDMVQEPQHDGKASRPRTPEHEVPAGEVHEPTWSIREVSTNSRPQSSSSTDSEMSGNNFSTFGSRICRPFSEGNCTTPDSEVGDPFPFVPVIITGKATLEDPFGVSATSSNNSSWKSHSNITTTTHFSQIEDDHLWSTFQLYLQDPKVTPWEMGASRIPPEGICHRIARQCKNNWRGFYTAWPHSDTATRQQLRNLCKQNRHTLSITNSQSRASTPLYRPHSDPRPNVFEVRSMGLALKTSMASSMQSDGFLAQLASEDSMMEDAPSSSTSASFGPVTGMETGSMNVALLGSPFVPSRSLRLSSTHPHSDFLGAQTNVLSRSLNASLKRRAGHDLLEDPSPTRLARSGVEKQPFGPKSPSRRVRRNISDDVFQPLSVPSGPGPIDLFGTSSSTGPVDLFGTSLQTFAVNPPTVPLLSASMGPMGPPPLPSRLGSPFVEEPRQTKTASRRFLSDGNTAVRRGQFSTQPSGMNYPHNHYQSRGSIVAFDFDRRSSIHQLQKPENLDRNQERDAKHDSDGDPYM